MTFAILINTKQTLEFTYAFPIFEYSYLHCRRQWSSLVEGDEQLDWPNSQTTVELFHASVAYFFGV